MTTEEQQTPKWHYDTNPDQQEASLMVISVPRGHTRALEAYTFLTQESQLKTWETTNKKRERKKNSQATKPPTNRTKNQPTKTKQNKKTPTKQTNKQTKENKKTPTN